MFQTVLNATPPFIVIAALVISLYSFELLLPSSTTSSAVVFKNIAGPKNSTCFTCSNKILRFADLHFLGCVTLQRIVNM